MNTEIYVKHWIICTSLLQLFHYSSHRSHDDMFVKGTASEFIKQQLVALQVQELSGLYWTQTILCAAPSVR